MKGRIFAGLFFCSLFFVVGGDAQSPIIPEKPVWTLEFIKVQPENFALAMQYLDDHWTRVRAEAKRQGGVLDYHLISNAGMVTPSHKVWDQDSIVLLTKYKNMDAYLESASEREHLAAALCCTATVGRRPFRSVEYPSIHRRARHDHGIQASHQAVGTNGDGLSRSADDIGCLHRRPAHLVLVAWLCRSVLAHANSP